MYYVSKRLEISFAHRLDLDYESKCSNLHGHNAVITVYCCSDNLDSNGMVTDFTKIKETICKYLDHKTLNDVFNFNPTAENLAMWICGQIPRCYKVAFQESEGNIAVYVKDGFENAVL